MSVVLPKKAHCIGVGGIHVSAVAKLLIARGVTVSGSDAFENDETKDLAARGAVISIGHHVSNLPIDAGVVIYSHAVPPENAELAEAKRRGIQCVDTHAFLAWMFGGAQQIVVTGSHGKSTTTSMLGLILASCGVNPTVIVGTKVPGFVDGNLRIGREDLLIVEGDEYQRHVLSYQPTVLVLNNVELDHVDVYPTIEAYEQVFREVVKKMGEGTVVVVNADDVRAHAIGAFARAEKKSLVEVGMNAGDVHIGKIESRDGGSSVDMHLSGDVIVPFDLNVPGEMNVRNAAMALAGARAAVPTMDLERAYDALAAFKGCWRRFERIGEVNGAVAVSDYGHHPTEVRATLAAAHEAFPDRRIVLAFQPHHRNRTKHLFSEFVASFDGADVLMLVEIYDVPGREATEDANVSSSQLMDAVKQRDVERGKQRPISFVPSVSDLAQAISSAGVTEQDVILFMGAGAIDAEARKMVN